MGELIKAEPGDAIISSATNRILLNVNGILRLFKEGGTEQQLSVAGYQEITEAKGQTLGVYTIPAQERARFILCIFTINEAEHSGTIIIAGNPIAITERSGSVGIDYKTTLTVVLPPGIPCTIEGSNPSHVSIHSLWESI